MTIYTEYLEQDESRLEWANISDEKYRTYFFPGGGLVSIEGPIALNISASGGHRVADRNGIAHYIPAGWYHLLWEVEAGSSRFRF